MNLGKGEQAVFAYFDSQEAARQAAAELRTMGFSDVEVSSIPRVPKGTKARGIMPGTQGSALSYVDSYVMMAGPDAVRMGGEPGEYPAAYDMADHNRYLVAVVCDTARSYQARDYLRSKGGKA